MIQFKKMKIAFASILLLSACNYRIEKQNPEDPSQPVTLDAKQITYQMVADRVLTGKCLNCHSASGGNRGRVNLENYQNVFNEREAIRDEVLAGTMPKAPTSPLTQSQKKLLLDWLEAGAHEFGVPEPTPVLEPTPAPEPTPVAPTPTPEPDPATPTPEPAPITEPLNFETVMKKVIEPKCWKCHGETGRNDLKLITYDDLFENRFEVKADIEDGSMPRKDKLTDEQKKLVLDWFAAGMPK